MFLSLELSGVEKSMAQAGQCLEWQDYINQQGGREEVDEGDVWQKNMVASSYIQVCELTKSTNQCKISQYNTPI